MHQVMKGQEQIDIALAIREKTRGPTDPQRGNAYHNKAILEYSAGRYDNAKAYNAKAHKIRQATKGNYLPVAHYHEGIINMLQGNLDAADVELGICADYVRAAGKSMDFLLAKSVHLYFHCEGKSNDRLTCHNFSNLFAQANVLLKRGEATAALNVLAQGRELVARMMPTTVLASAYEYKTGYANFKLGFLEIALKHFENSIDLANRREIECETARGLRMKAIVQKELGSLLGSEEGEAGDAMKAAEEILRRFEIRENWDLSHYLDEEEKYDMLVCGQRR
ncbi:hypothetical protein K4F52_003004 [Lecanicillium sp. MT-2017a]|nr:hypothetical protein K4F52_003004 [Lecanicillium sp. MT-2017a]